MAHQTLAIIGPGRLGHALARLALRAGIRVVLAGSGAPIRIRQAAEMFAPGAEVATATDAVRDADLVVLALPLSNALLDLDEHLVDDRVVIDATNYWPETDGAVAEYDDAAGPTSVLVQEHFSGAHVVKALSHMSFRDLEMSADRAAPTIAVGIAADDADARGAVEHLVRAIGFIPVDVGTLAESGVLGPKSVVFGAVLDASAFRSRLRDG